MEQLKAHERWLSNRMPLIGGCLRQRAAQALAHDGSPNAVQMLAKAIARSNDRQVLAIALDALRQVTTQQCIDEVCAVWSVTRHKDLAKLLTKKGWVASAPVEIKVLSALKAGQLEAVTKGRAEIVEPLLKAFNDTDSEIASRASQCAIALTNLEAQEFLCHLVVEKDHKIARQITINAQYAPHDSNQRALFLFLTEQWEKYEDLDFEQTLLQTAYLVANEQLRQRITQKLRQAGRVEWVQVLAGGVNRLRLAEMTDSEWETTIAVLSQGRDWQEIWRLAQVAPPLWSVQLLQKLKKAEWVPKTEFVKLMFMGNMCTTDVLDKPNSLWRCQAILQDEYNYYCNLVISSDSKLLASSSCDHAVRLWSLPNGKPLQTLIGHNERVNCLAISPDDKLLASGGEDATVKLWSLPDGKLLQTLRGHTGPVRYLTISPNGDLLASGGSNDITVRLWSLPNGEPLQMLTGHDERINCLTISPDSKLLISGSDNYDYAVSLWSLPDGKLLQTLTDHKAPVNCLAISPDSKLLASGSDDFTIKLWSLPDGKLLKTLTGRDGRINCLVISPNGKLLAGNCDSHVVKLWSLPDGKLLETLTEGRPYCRTLDFLAISPDSKLLASGDDDYTVRLWSLPDAKPLQTLTGNEHYTDYLAYLAISPDSKLLASGDNDHTIRLWTSGLRYLSRLPVEQMSAEDMQWIQEALQNETISGAERNWLEFIRTLVHWQQRFNIEVEEAPQRTDIAEFDIEIEG